MKIIQKITKQLSNVLLIGVILGMVGTGCYTDYIPIDLKYEGDETLQFSASGETKPLTFQSNTNEWEISSDASWLSIDNKSSGINAGLREKSPYTVNVTASKNDSFDNRTAKITITGFHKKTTGGNYYKLDTIINVTQAGTPPIFICDKDTILFESIGGSQIFDITSNTVWTITWPADNLWLRSINPKSSNIKEPVTVTVPVTVEVDANESTTDRKEIITVTPNNNNLPPKTIVVKQKGKEFVPTLTINKDKINFDAIAHDPESFTITSNTPWMFIIKYEEGDDEWLQTNPFKEEHINKGETPVSISAIENLNTTGRTATITFYYIIAGKSEPVPDLKITVTQAGAGDEGAKIPPG